MQIGDAIHEALQRIGVTDDRVHRWLGRDCTGCRARRDKLNALGAWAARVLGGRLGGAGELLDGIVGDD